MLVVSTYMTHATKACIECNIQPSLAVAREHHHLSVFELFAPNIPAPITDDHPVMFVIHQPTTEAGRALYVLRKQTVDTVFGIIKHAMRLRRFSMRSLEKVTGE